MLSYHQAWVVLQVEDHAISRLRHHNQEPPFTLESSVQMKTFLDANTTLS